MLVGAMAPRALRNDELFDFLIAQSAMRTQRLIQSGEIVLVAARADDLAVIRPARHDDEIAKAIEKRIRIVVS